MANQTTCGAVVRTLPWICVALGVTLLVLGLMWRHITDAHEANGPLIAAGIFLGALAFAISCVTDMPTKKDDTRDDAPEKEGGEPVRNMGSGAEFNQVPFLSL
jgi:hypothetical protein